VAQVEFRGGRQGQPARRIEQRQVMGLWDQHGQERQSLRAWWLKPTLKLHVLPAASECLPEVDWPRNLLARTLSSRPDHSIRRGPDLDVHNRVIRTVAEGQGGLTHQHHRAGLGKLGVYQAQEAL
jgi:hypothetical protein